MTGALIERGELPVGVTVAGELLRHYALRAARLADVYAAVAAVPVPDALDRNTPARVAYQMAIDDTTVLAQVARLDAMPGTVDTRTPPALADLIASIDPDDMAELRAAAERLKKKLRAPRNGSPDGEGPSASSSAPASG